MMTLLDLVIGDLDLMRIEGVTLLFSISTGLVVDFSMEGLYFMKMVNAATHFS